MKKHNPMCPAHGIFKGGALDGQRYAFQRVEITPAMDTLLHVRVSDGVWPFPCDRAFPLDAFRGVLWCAIKGDRARRFNIDEAIESATVAHVEMVMGVQP